MATFVPRSVGGAEESNSTVNSKQSDHSQQQQNQNQGIIELLAPVEWSNSVHTKAPQPHQQQQDAPKRQRRSRQEGLSGAFSPYGRCYFDFSFRNLLYKRQEAGGSSTSTSSSGTVATVPVKPSPSLKHRRKVPGTTTFSPYTLMFHNAVLEAEFLVYFHRNRQAHLITLFVCCLLSVFELISVYSEASSVGVAFILSCFGVWIVSMMCYEYLRRRAAAIYEEFQRTIDTPLTSPGGGSSEGPQSDPMLLFSSKSLFVANDPIRKELRRNAFLHEIVIIPVMIGIILLHECVMVEKANCYGDPDPQRRLELCVKVIGYDSMVVMFLTAIVALTTSRFPLFIALVSTLVGVTTAENWSTWSPEVVTSKVICSFTINVVVALVCLVVSYLYEREKRMDFLKIVRLCAKTEEAAIVRRKVHAVAAASVPVSPTFMFSREAEDANGIFEQCTDRGIVCSVSLVNFASFVVDQPAFDIAEVLHTMFSMHQQTQTAHFSALDDSRRRADNPFFRNARRYTFQDGDVLMLCIVPREEETPVGSASLGLDEAFAVLCWDAFKWLAHTTHLANERRKKAFGLNPLDNPRQLHAQGAMDVGPLFIAASETKRSSVHIFAGGAATLSRRRLLERAARHIVAGGGRSRRYSCVGSATAEKHIRIDRTSSEFFVHEGFPGPRAVQGEFRERTAELHIPLTFLLPLRSISETMGQIDEDELMPSGGMEMGMRAVAGGVAVMSDSNSAIFGVESEAVSYNVNPLSVFSNRQSLNTVAELEEEGQRLPTVAPPSQYREYVDCLFLLDGDWMEFDHAAATTARSSAPSLPPDHALQAGGSSSSIGRRSHNASSTSDPLPSNNSSGGTAANTERTIDLVVPLRPRGEDCSSCSLPTKILSAINQFVFGAFEIEQYETKFLAKRTEAFPEGRLLVQCACSALVSIMMCSLVVAVAFYDDSLDFSSAVSFHPRQGALFWFTLSFVLAAAEGVSAHIIRDGVSRHLYRVLFASHICALLVGVFLSPKGSTLQRSTVVMFIIIADLSLLHPQWNGVAVMVTSDVIVCGVFVAREILVMDRVPRGRQVAIMQACFVLIEVFAVRVLQEHQDRHHFACMEDTEVYGKRIQKDLDALREMLLYLAPDERIATEMVRRFNVVAEIAALPPASHHSSGGSDPLYVDGVSASHQTVWHTVALRTSPVDIYFASCAVMIAPSTIDSGASSPNHASPKVVMQQFLAESSARRQLHRLIAKVCHQSEPHRADAAAVTEPRISTPEVSFVMNSLSPEAVLCSTSPVALVAAVRLLLAALSREGIHLKVFLHCGDCVGGVLGDHSETATSLSNSNQHSMMRFEYYGASISHCCEIMRSAMDWGSIAASGRFWRSFQWHSDEQPHRSDNGSSIVGIRSIDTFEGAPKRLDGTALSQHASGDNHHGVSHTAPSSSDAGHHRHQLQPVRVLRSDGTPLPDAIALTSLRPIADASWRVAKQCNVFGHFLAVTD